MSDEQAEPEFEKYQERIATGAWVNFLGIVGKALAPIFFVLIARLYGPATLGVFYVAYVIIQIAVNLTVSGFNDGVLMFSSRYIEDKHKQDRLYQVFANGFLITFIISILLILFTYFGGARLVLSRYPQPELLDALQKMVWAIPFIVVPILVVAATKSLLTMKWDALVKGFLTPLFLIIFCLIFYFFRPGLEGLILSFLCAHILLTFISLFIFKHYFSYKQLYGSFLHFRFFRPLVTFAIPQNLNMSFNTFVTNLDVIMLGYFGFRPEILGFYGMGAQIVRNIRQVKLAFAGAYAPVIARLYERRDIKKMSQTFSMISRWIISFGFPIAILVIIFKEEFLKIFHSSFVYDSTFMILLLVPPILSCAVGLSANIIVMTGHSKWNLFNSVLIAGVNFLLNLLLIPRFGIMGAATATVIASLVVSSLQVIEAYFLAGTRLILKEIYKPYVAILPSVFFLGLVSVTGLQTGIIIKISTAVISLALYAGTYALLGPEREDMEALFPWFVRRNRVSGRR